MEMAAQEQLQLVQVQEEINDSENAEVPRQNHRDVEVDFGDLATVQVPDHQNL
jgi:hypothetical protein